MILAVIILLTVNMVIDLSDKEVDTFQGASLVLCTWYMNTVLGIVVLCILGSYVIIRAIIDS